jgi:prepilin-type N-terminal cleavage/methylation domain-containing protein
MTIEASSDDGFGLTETIVALAIVAIGLAAFCQALGNTYRTSARLKSHTAALAVTRSYLDLLSQDATLAPGISSGRYANDMTWRLTVSPLLPNNASPASAERPYWLVLETYDRRGVSMVRLETAKMIRETP